MSGSANSHGVNDHDRRDLHGIVSHVSRDTQVNDPMTRAYLDAGLRLMVAHFSHQPPAIQAGPAEQISSHRFFDWISQRKVIEEARRQGVPAKQGTLRDRWEPHAGYLADLMAYALWRQHWLVQIASMDEVVTLLASAGDFVQAAHEVAYREIQAAQDNQFYRVQLLAAPLAETDPVIADAIRRTYQSITESWKSLCELILAARGMTLRPGVTTEDLAHMLTAAADGFGLRILGDPLSEAEIVDHDRRRSLFGTMALTLVAALIDSGDNRPIERIVTEAIAGRRRRPDSSTAESSAPDH